MYLTNGPQALNVTVCVCVCDTLTSIPKLSSDLVTTTVQLDSWPMSGRNVAKKRIFTLNPDTPEKRQKGGTRSESSARVTPRGPDTSVQTPSSPPPQARAKFTLNADTPPPRTARDNSQSMPDAVPLKLNFSRVAAPSRFASVLSSDDEDDADDADEDDEVFVDLEDGYSSSNDDYLSGEEDELPDLLTQSDSESDDEDEPQPIRPQQSRSASSKARVVTHPKKSVLSDANLHRGDNNMVAYDKKRWTVNKERRNKRSGGPRKLRLLNKQSQETYIVAEGRVNKALRYLDTRQATEIMGHECCAKKCNCQFTLDNIMNARIPFFAETASEHEASVHLLKLIRHDAGHLRVNNQQVCRTFYTRVYGISKEKLRNITLTAAQGPDAKLPTSVQKTRSRPGFVTSTKASATPVGDVDGTKYVRCVAFWTHFFKLCQRPRKHMRLFPVNKSHPRIYDDYFTAWHKRTYPKLPMPGLETMKKARKNPQFDDVKKRSKHFHCRCFTCAELQAQRLKAFKTGADATDWQIRNEIHELSVWAWRDLEQYFTGLAISAPHTIAILSMDDTEKLGLPLFTRRDYKSLGASRQYWVPFLIYDHGLNSKDYMYSSYGRFKKGANRYCTQLYHAVRRIKADPSHPSHKARRLVIIGDNYSENKNNIVLKFWADVVICGWFDEVLILYGPVGHTHFWIDQDHGVHNNELCNNTAGDLGHLISFYPQAWTREEKRPHATVMDVQYDWEKYYEECGSAIAGFTNTKGNHEQAHGFRIARGKDGNTTLTFKRDATDREWLGQDGYPNSAGFNVLTSRPKNVPSVIEPIEHAMKKKHLKQLSGENIRKAMDAEDLLMCREPLLTASVHGVLAAEDIQPIVAPGDWGYRAKIGAKVKTEVQIIGHPVLQSAWNGARSVFDLPESVAATAIQHGFLLPAAIPDLRPTTLTETDLNNRPLPYVGYKNVPRNQRGTFNHPVMVNHRLHEDMKELEEEDLDEPSLMEIYNNAPTKFAYPQQEQEQEQEREQEQDQESRRKGRRKHV